MSGSRADTEELLEQCRLGIEAPKALHPPLPEDAATHALRLVSSLQLAHADAAS